MSYSASPYSPKGYSQLNIRLSKDIRIPAGTSLHRAFAYDQTGWKANMAAAAASTINGRINALKVSYSSGPTPSAAQNVFQDRVKPYNTDKRDGQLKLDSLAERTALRQMRASIAVFEAAVGKSAGFAGQTSLVPIDLGLNQYALEVNLTVQRPSAVSGHLADLIDGLITGLIGGNRGGSLIEGVAAVLRSPDGPVAGSWSAARAGTGSIDFSQHYFDPSSFIYVTRQFPDLTNGPITKGSYIQ